MKKTKLCITLTIAVFINAVLFSQEQDWPCDKIVHGLIYNIHMDCNQNILITSLEEDSLETIDDGSETIYDNQGTCIVGGIITTKGSIFIKPGNSFVSIVSKEGKNKTARTHSTKIKSNGNDSGYENNTPTFFKEVKIFPNPIKNTVTIKSDNNKKIMGYELLNMYGTTIKSEQVKSTNKHTFLVAEIKKGIYLLKIKFNTGTQQTKTIIKN